mmetsp:Transcript_17609/g.36492  ORF Transcript_17609/g.36492 Transcript_17609/m.36492 type:complete len:318 (+) Transcript_17609:2257-3210(+)
MPTPRGSGLRILVCSVLQVHMEMTQIGSIASPVRLVTFVTRGAGVNTPLMLPLTKDISVPRGTIVKQDPNYQHHVLREVTIHFRSLEITLIVSSVLRTYTSTLRDNRSAFHVPRPQFLRPVLQHASASVSTEPSRLLMGSVYANQAMNSTTRISNASQTRMETLIASLLFSTGALTIRLGICLEIAETTTTAVFSAEIVVANTCNDLESVSAMTWMIWPLFVMGTAGIRLTSPFTTRTLKCWWSEIRPILFPPPSPAIYQTLLVSSTVPVAVKPWMCMGKSARALTIPNAPRVTLVATSTQSRPLEMMVSSGSLEAL